MSIIQARAETPAQDQTARATDSEYTLPCEMPLAEWHYWRRRLRALLAQCRSAAERGFVSGQLYRLDEINKHCHPVYAEIAVPPSEYAIARIEWIEQRGSGRVRS